MNTYIWIIVAITLLISSCSVLVPKKTRPVDLSALKSPVLFQGDAEFAYRDPTAIYVNGFFWLFFTYNTHNELGEPFWQVAYSKSKDLADWSEPFPITPKDLTLNFSSPGNIIRFGNQWVMCLQTYPTPHREKYGTSGARLWIMRSDDLETWSEPELLRVKGSYVPQDNMGRMIDPYIVKDKNEPGKWWCFFKQNGASRSWSYDLQTWNFVGNMDAGENVCVLVDGDEYVMFHAPEDNGIGVKRSPNLINWMDEGVFYLDQENWDWARGRITAAFVLDGREIPGVERYLMFYHASGPEDERTMFHTHASLAIAWSKDLNTWSWPQ